LARHRIAALVAARGWQQHAHNALLSIAQDWIKISSAKSASTSRISGAQHQASPLTAGVAFAAAWHINKDAPAALKHKQTWDPKARINSVCMTLLAWRATTPARLVSRILCDV